jgi:uncharacterized membrane protein
MPELLHPFIVHLPLGLAVMLPALLLLLSWQEGKGRLTRSAWSAVLLVQALVVLGSFAAMKTGGMEEERVERGVPEAAIHAHEEAAEVFTWAGAGLLLLTVLPLLPLGAGLRRVVPFILLGLSLVALALALRTGKAGGELVYQHQAAAARAGLTVSGGAAAPPADAAADAEDDD